MTCSSARGALWESPQCLELPPQVPETLFDPGPDGAVLLFAVCITGLAGILSGLVPALDASRPELVPALKSGGAGSVDGGGAARSFFVVLEPLGSRGALKQLIVRDPPPRSHFVRPGARSAPSPWSRCSSRPCVQRRSSRVKRFAPIEVLFAPADASLRRPLLRRGGC